MAAEDVSLGFAALVQKGGTGVPDVSTNPFAAIVAIFNRNADVAHGSFVQLLIPLNVVLKHTGEPEHSSDSDGTVGESSSGRRAATREQQPREWIALANVEGSSNMLGLCAGHVLRSGCLEPGIPEGCIMLENISTNEVRKAIR